MTALLSRRSVPGRRARTPEAKRWRRAWVLTPLLVFFFLGGFTFMLTKAVAGMIALGIALLASRRPDRALLALVIGLPFQLITLSYLFALGVPAEIVRPLAAWKEGLGIGILLAAIKTILNGNDVTRRPHVTGRIASVFDRLDAYLLSYVGLILVFTMFPRFLAPDAPIGSETRSLAFRATAGFVLLFFAARHVNLPAEFSVRLRKAILRVGVAVSSIGIFEFFFSDTWNTFSVHRIQLPRYQVLVLGLRPFSLSDVRFHGEVAGTEIVRIGSVLYTPLSLAFFLVIGFAVALEEVVRRGLRLSSGLALVTFVGALLVNQTRAALIGAIIIAFVAFRPLPGRPTRNRIRLALVLSAGLVLAIPAAASTPGLVDRATGAVTGDDESTQDHIDGFWRGIEALADAPLGHGLGTSAGVGQRFGGGTEIITENYYLQVGVEMGIFATVLFLLLVIQGARTLTRASVFGDELVAALRGAFIGLAFGAALLHTWIDVAISWSAWGPAGAVLGIAERARGRSSTSYDDPPPAMMVTHTEPAI